MKIFIPKSLSLAVSLAIAGAAGSVFAQNNQQEAGDLEEVVVTGSRAKPRSVFDSAVPVDVVSGDDFVNQGGSDLSTLLRNVVPSYNVNAQPISDAATIVRPANMRGLAPDHTLVLVNGKRRHRAAVIYWLGNGVADGAQGPDISPIPSIALKQVEVLRDGAAAQYGSDAIAGVMNFILKDDAEGGSLEIKYGEYYEGDGDKVTVAGNVGMPFTDDGFFNVSFEYGNSDPTDRSIQRADAAALIAAGNTDVGNPAQVWGSPEIKDELKLMYNMGLEIGGGREFFSFGNYMSKEVEGGFFFRNPDTRGGVFSADGGVTRLVADLTPTDGNACPTVNVGDAAALAGVMADPNCFVFNEMFPGGFTPSFGGQATDAAITAGVRGTTESNLNWELSGSYGYNDVSFFIKNTVNASMGPQSPTSFEPGDYTQQDINLNADFSYALPVDAFASDLNIAAGLEWRQETFEITVGDEDSYRIGPYADQGFSSASNGFPGFSPLAGGSFSRKNVAAYVDLEANVMDPWLLAVAFRWEDFSDFGSTFNGKIATNVAITDAISFRASYSTGFRAPTPGQSNAFNVSTEFDSVTGDLVNNGTIPSTSPIALQRGGQALDPETSTSATMGLLFDFDSFSVTADIFTIELEDRITVSQNFNLSATEKAALIAQGVAGADSIDNFRFFTNDFDTTTSGVDIVATWDVEMLGGVTDFSLAYNYTETEVDSFTPAIIDATRIRELQEGLPESRWNISANHNLDDWRFMLRLSYYNDYYDSEDDKTYGDEFIVDAEVEYNINENYAITLGAQNLFDEYPDENPDGATQSGRRYGQYNPAGFNGGFYYLKAKYNF